MITRNIGYLPFELPEAERDLPNEEIFENAALEEAVVTKACEQLAEELAFDAMPWSKAAEEELPFKPPFLEMDDAIEALAAVTAVATVVTAVEVVLATADALDSRARAFLIILLFFENRCSSR